MKYQFTEIEPRWQAYWDQHKTFHAANPGEPGFDPDRQRFYVLDMFPYPSGVGLHVGHPLGYIATDILARYKRMRGYHVLHPMGYDAFGLPAEQYAVETGVHPRQTTEQNIATMTAQLKRLGLGYDWDRQVATTDPSFYRWTQWVFLQLYHSYFDAELDRARPIRDLVHDLENEEYLIGLDGDLVGPHAEGLDPIEGGPIGAYKWYELTADQQSRLLDEYRLAYMDEVEVNWCPELGTVLANEEVTAEGRSERGNHPVHRRPLRQWMLRITAYADRLLDELDAVDWPEPIKIMQRNWIGRSQGAQVDFVVDSLEQAGDSELIQAFTTRPDTLFGATYMVLSPEHPLVDSITADSHRNQVRQYQREAAAKTETNRQTERTKTGVFTGAYALNPVNGEHLPVYLADYVMMTYGTGAIMAVPAHDERDFAFAKQYDLPIRQVVRPVGSGDKRAEEQAENPDQPVTQAFTGEGANVNSKHDDLDINDLPTAEAKREVIDWLERNGVGRGQVQYKLRDWLFSRQRYWGEPFPILHGPDGQVRAVDESDLPVELPEVDRFKPEPPPEESAQGSMDAPPRPPLANAPESWRKVVIDGVEYKRELNTMPQWAGSCWYYLRFLDPHNDQRFVGPEVERYWMGTPSQSGARAHSNTHAHPNTHDHPAPGGVDLYVGGAEHAVLHLLYARFWHKVLYDLGHVSTLEPFAKLFNQGYIQGFYYEDERGVRVPAVEVVNAENRPASEVQGQEGQKFFYNGQAVTERYGKMGKSLKNAITPDDVCQQYGADTLRLYEMYMGPLDQSKAWDPNDIVGVHRFLQRLWRNFIDEQSDDLKIGETPPDKDLARKTHQTIKRVTDSMEAMSFNVAIAALIELNNDLVPLERVPHWVAESLIRLLGPFAPHVCEELWSRLGNAPSIADADWPEADPDMLIEDEIEYPVQVNGKMRAKITVPADADDARIESAAKGDPNVATHLEGKTIRKTIVVPGRLINLVVN